MANEWIDVKERLPEIGTDKQYPYASDEVLVTNGKRKVTTAYIEHSVWIDYDGNELEFIVTHWQPLPTPPNK